MPILEHKENSVQCSLDMDWVNKEAELVLMKDLNKIRSTYNEDLQEYVFPCVDIIKHIKKPKNPTKEWDNFKRRHLEEHPDILNLMISEKFENKRGQMRKMDSLTLDGALQLIMVLTGKEAGKYRVKFAQIIHQRMEEEIDPTLAIDRGVKQTLNKKIMTPQQLEKYTKNKIERETVNNELKEFGASTEDYIKVHKSINESAFEMTPSEHKKFKHLKPYESLPKNYTGEESTMNTMGLEMVKSMLKDNDEGKSIDEVTDEVCKGLDKACRIIEDTIGHKLASSDNLKTLKDKRENKMLL